MNMSVIHHSCSRFDSQFYILFYIFSQNNNIERSNNIFQIYKRITLARVATSTLTNQPPYKPIIISTIPEKST